MSAPLTASSGASACDRTRPDSDPAPLDLACELLASPSFDPSRTSSLPWASGAAGIAYNIATTGKEIKTIEDFLAVEGTKTVLTEMRDTLGLFMLADGKDITKPTFDDAAPSFDLIAAALDDGRICPGQVVLFAKVIMQVEELPTVGAVFAAVEEADEFPVAAMHRHRRRQPVGHTGIMRKIGKDGLAR